MVRSLPPKGFKWHAYTLDCLLKAPWSAMEKRMGNNEQQKKINHLPPLAMEKDSYNTRLPLGRRTGCVHGQPGFLLSPVPGMHAHLPCLLLTPLPSSTFFSSLKAKSNCHLFVKLAPGSTPFPVGRTLKEGVGFFHPCLCRPRAQQLLSICFWITLKERQGEPLTSDKSALKGPSGALWSEGKLVHTQDYLGYCSVLGIPVLLTKMQGPSQGSWPCSLYLEALGQNSTTLLGWHCAPLCSLASSHDQKENSFDIKYVQKS